MKNCITCVSTSLFLSRRLKRWIQDKQQREKNAIAAVRRQRHKSLGDVETVSKNKRQQQQSLFHHFSTCPPQVSIASCIVIFSYIII